MLNKVSEQNSGVFSHLSGEESVCTLFLVCFFKSECLLEGKTLSENFLNLNTVQLGLSLISFATKFYTQSSRCRKCSVPVSGSWSLGLFSSSGELGGKTFSEIARS